MDVFATHHFFAPLEAMPGGVCLLTSMGASAGTRGLGVGPLWAPGMFLSTGVISQDSYAACLDLSKEGTTLLVNHCCFLLWGDHSGQTKPFLYLEELRELIQVESYLVGCFLVVCLLVWDGVAGKGPDYCTGTSGRLVGTALETLL